MSLVDAGDTPPPAAGSDPAPRHSALAECDTFVGRVREACANSGTQQALRRALAKPVDEVPARTHAALLRNGLVPDTAGGATRRAYYAVAALIAARPRAERFLDTVAREATDETAPADVPDSQLRAAVNSTATTAGQASRTGERPGPGTAAQTSETRPRFSWGTSLGASLAQAVTRGGQDAVKEDGVESRLHLLVRQETDGLHRMLPAVLRQLGSAGITADYGRLLYDVRRWQYDRDATATRWLEDYYRVLRRARQTQNRTQN
ncbi:type I-E CRISPR-associated protein Cse2/CasB [Streptomyces lushanensis]|uniref:type I-E CRISPR-associated protein Cse2/CasB n=1 Tax=Streptomyces lushanensis TaxID=1434255 RepID=UPI0009A067DD|nr:type I-E CRISPR-associated protein Cse2/CasB [Streptomyces lushanensis]